MLTLHQATGNQVSTWNYQGFVSFSSTFTAFWCLRPGSCMKGLALAENHVELKKLKVFLFVSPNLLFDLLLPTLSAAISVPLTQVLPLAPLAALCVCPCGKMQLFSPRRDAWSDNSLQKPANNKKKRNVTCVNMKKGRTPFQSICVPAWRRCK